MSYFLIYKLTDCIEVKDTAQSKVEWFHWVFDFEKCCDLEIRVKGHSRSSEPIPPPMTSYKRYIVTMSLSRTVSEIDGDFSRKSQIFPTHIFNAPA